MVGREDRAIPEKKVASEPAAPDGRASVHRRCCGGGGERQFDILHRFRITNDVYSGLFVEQIDRSLLRVIHSRIFNGTALGLMRDGRETN